MHRENVTAGKYLTLLKKVSWYLRTTVTVKTAKDLQVLEKLPSYSFQKKYIELKGNLKFYELKGSSGSHIQRGFCENCGSGILSYAKEIPHINFIKAGTLDDSSWVKADSNFFIDSAHDWNKPDNTIKSFNKNPSMISNIKTLIKSF